MCARLSARRRRDIGRPSHPARAPRPPGQVLPLGLNKLRLDAAHASTSIQVIMDVLGVLITCTVAPFVFTNLAPLLSG